MKLTDVTVTIVRETAEPTDNREQCAVIAITAEDGTTGYGEANANPAAVKALLDTDLGLRGNWDDGPARILRDADATDPRSTWQVLKARSFWSCRAGVGHVALAGVGMALWDLAGKLAGCPVWQLLGTARSEPPVPYVTLHHGAAPFADTLARTLDALDAALAAGFRAIKVEPLVETAPEADDIVELVHRVRDRAGPDVTLLADVGYRWSDPAEAIGIARRLEEFDLFALEAPFPPHDVAAHRRLAAAVPTPIASGDQLTAAVEYLPLLDSGAVAYLQGGACRTGIDDLDLLARSARERDRGVIPWGWVATAATVAANLQLALTHDNVPLIEYAPPSLYPQGRLRAELFEPEPAIGDGRLAWPTVPGLGVSIDPDALARFTVA